MADIDHIEALQALYAAANHAAAVIGNDAECWRLERIAQDSEEALLIATGHPPRWVEETDREFAGTSIRELWRSGRLPRGCEGPLTQADILTVEEMAERTESAVAALSGIGPARVAALTALLDEYGLEWADAQDGTHGLRQPDRR